MTEKDMFVHQMEREFATTMKILKQLPPEKAEFTPTKEKTKSAKGLAEMFVGELGVINGTVNGKIEFNKPPSFLTYDEVLKAYEKTFKDLVPRVKAMPESDWNSNITLPVGPQKMGDVRRGDVCWLMLNDSIHHRGQFSIYLRLVGAKVPSIYGPSADEPWN